MIAGLSKTTRRSHPRLPSHGSLAEPPVRAEVGMGGAGRKREVVCHSSFLGDLDNTPI